MKYIRVALLTILVLCMYASCRQDASKEKMINLVKKWEKKQVIYPSETAFTIYGEDTVVDYVKSGVKYSIVSYIDSLGCLSCKLQAKAWKSFIKTIDSVSDYSIPVNIFVHNKDGDELLSILRKEAFDMPICLDLNDSLRLLNDFPDDIAFRTFLLDKDNRVVAIGNPIFNPKIKELYLNIIHDEEVVTRKGNEAPKTELFIDKNFVDFGSFDWHKEQKGVFVFSNQGDIPLVIEGVITSCDCTTVDYPKEPVRPGMSVELLTVYKADHPEYFNKTITVYCNVETSPIVLRITGNAEQQ